MLRQLSCFPLVLQLKTSLLLPFLCPLTYVTCFYTSWLPVKLQQPNPTCEPSFKTIPPAARAAQSAGWVFSGSHEDNSSVQGPIPGAQQCFHSDRCLTSSRLCVQLDTPRWPYRTPQETITIACRGLPHFARVLLARSSPMKRAKSLNARALSLGEKMGTCREGALWCGCDPNQTAEVCSPTLPAVAAADGKVQMGREWRRGSVCALPL